MKPIHRSLASVFVLLGSIPHSLCGQAGNERLTTPTKMRLCIPSGCNNLTLRGNRYDGTIDGQPTVFVRYWVRQWSPAFVEITGRTVASAKYGMPGEGTFTGRIAPDGTSLENTRDDWSNGSDKGTLPFTLTWGGAPYGAPYIASPAVEDFGPVDKVAVCRSQQMKRAMEMIVKKEVSDAGGGVLGTAACLVAGVCPKRDPDHPEQLEKVGVTTVGSGAANDTKSYTSNDPGSFLCVGVLVRKEIHLETMDSSDGPSASQRVSGGGV